MYTGLPEELTEYLFNYTNEELLHNPIDIVKSIIRMQAVIKGGMGGLIAMIDNDDDSQQVE